MSSPVIIDGSVGGFQVETNTNTHQVVMQARTTRRLTPAGMAAVASTLSTYYNSTLAAAQLATAPSYLFEVATGAVVCWAYPGTETALAASLISAVGTNTVQGG